ncbi:30S ribosomal protein S6 modification protein RimK [Flavobacterium sp. 316]|uniref:ATP-grasp domain-containing protein n=1 Tax=Flavobacterium sp. 316 TaxID=1603293 RepID=UPI0005E9F01E|nr:ATP-grasp domain-containing protein [Flavobacterium sp. 316]KIX20249.1 30S ribosomal protein S6 modification protein RimK [Flavobacterium sp. 316]
MQTILVLNGEKYWQDYLPEFTVVQKKIQDSDFILKDKKLFVVDSEGVCAPDLIIWRLGAISPNWKHRTALEIIKSSNVVCLNSAETLLQGYDRLSMLHVLSNLGMPVIPFQVVTHSRLLKNIAMPFPFVVKVGNYHGGYGKVLVQNAEKWQDIQDLLFVTNDYSTIEPYIDYQFDIRYLIVKDKVWAMQRKGQFWKSNVLTNEFQLIEVSSIWETRIRKVSNHLKADILALDVLIDKEGNEFIVEYNDIPGLSGFPETVKVELIKVIKRRIEA